ncbi:hypothetical protein F4824DRAFT_312620 [Ustulina deusta]|nr:hypothetical protein F4824DRAFT_312620 [Ustulina deusta]
MICLFWGGSRVGTYLETSFWGKFIIFLYRILLFLWPTALCIAAVVDLLHSCLSSPEIRWGHKYLASCNLCRVGKTQLQPLNGF